MWRKKIMLLALVLLSLCLSYQAVCYSSASVKNIFNVNVSSSEKALIAIPKEDIIVNIQIEHENSFAKTASTKTLAKNESKSVHTTEKIENINLLSHNLTIKNNMQYKLTNVQAILKNNPDLLRFYSDGPILPGQEVKLSFNINKDDDNIGSILSSADEPLILMISADWNSGSAEIEKNIRFIVESKEITIEENPVPTMPAKTAGPKRTAAPSSKPVPTPTPEVNTTEPSPEPTPAPTPAPTSEPTLDPAENSAEPNADPEPTEPIPGNSAVPENDNSSNEQTNDEQ